MADNIIAMHSIPLFHGLGWMAICYSVSKGCTMNSSLFSDFRRAISIQVVCGLSLAVFKPQTPAIVPNPTNTVEAAISDGFDYILSLPTFPEVCFINRL